MAMVAQVFQSLMEYGNRSKHLDREVTRLNSVPGVGSRRRQLNTTDVQAFEAELTEKIKLSNGLSNIQSSSEAMKWAVVTNTGYTIGKVGKGGSTAMASSVLQETRDSVLMSRRKLLETKGWSSLRTGLWLAANEWLQWNTSGTNLKTFEYWDRIPEQRLDEQRWYNEEKAERIHLLFSDDLESLEKLGNDMIGSKGVCNNPDESVKKRVISLKMYRLTKAYLEARAFESSVHRG